MKKIKINILYWDSGEKQRLDNTNLSWFYLKNLCLAAKEKGIIIEPYLFDFSEHQILDEAIHIPYPKGVYKRSEKINKVIEYHNSDEDYIFSVMDSDVIIKPDDYDYFIDLLRTIKDNKFYVFHLDDLQNNKGVDYVNKIVYTDKIETLQRNQDPDLGAYFLLNIKLLEEIDGFDERFTIWSCEDNAASYSLQKLGYKKVIFPIKPIHLPHVNLMNSIMGTKEYDEQVKILKNDYINGK